MSALTVRRAQVATYLTNALTGITIHDYRPVPSAMRNGWLTITQTDTEDTAFGEYRVQYNVTIPLETDDIAAEKAYEALAPDLLEALAELGRGVTARPYTINLDAADVYCVVATLITETEAA